MKSNATDVTKGKKKKESQARKLPGNVNEKGLEGEAARVETSDATPLTKDHPARKPSFKWYGTA